MLSDFESGHLTRRQLAVSISTLVSGAQAAPKPEGLRAVTLNHVTVRVPDVQRTSRFYQEFFGMPLKQHSGKTHIHFDFGIAGLQADDVIARRSI